MSVIAHWKMNDDADDAIVVDSSGSHTGTFYDTNTPATKTSDHSTTGQVNEGLDFDSSGSDEYITVADHADFSPTLTPFSVTSWVSLGNEGAATFYILNKLDTNKLEWDFKIHGDTLMFLIHDITENSRLGRKDADPADAYTAYEGSGIFIFVVGTYDGGTTSASIKLYLNGVQCDDANEESSPGDFVTLRNNDATLYMGKDYGGVDFANGVIDNVVVYNTELTESEILDLYNNGDGTENPLPSAATGRYGALGRNYRRSRY